MAMSVKSTPTSALSGDSPTSSYLIQTGKQITAGALSGCVECCVTYPTDYVKVMQQLDDRSGSKRRFHSSFDVLRHTIKNHGPLGLYRGFSVVFWGAFPKYSCRFGSYEQLKRLFQDENGTLKPQQKLICGLGAGIAEALFAVIPMDTIKVKLINDRFSEKPKFNGLIHGIREIVRETGIKGTYQGVMPTLLKQSSNQAIRFFVFDSLREWHQKRNDGNGSKLMMPLFGAIAGSASVFANTPIDVVKTRMQGLDAHRYKGTVDCITRIFVNEGVRGLYKGLTPRLVKVSMEVAIAFTMYNTFLELFSANNSKQ